MKQIEIDGEFFPDLYKTIQYCPEYAMKQAEIFGTGQYFCNDKGFLEIPEEISKILRKDLWNLI